MGLFSAIVKTTVNVATLPVAIVKDVLTMGNQLGSDEKDSYTKQKLDQIKIEAEDD